MQKLLLIRNLKRNSFNFNDMKSEIINGLMPILSDKTGRVLLSYLLLWALKRILKKMITIVKKMFSLRKLLIRKKFLNKNK